ncbi:MAG: DUF86 domain-containing protein [Planctomycetota bacterium]
MRDHRLYLDDIREAAKRIDSYAEGFSIARFKKNTLVVDAVVRNLEIIGEAIKHIPVQIRKKHPEIEWKKIAGLRDILAHEYFGIDVDVVWDIVNNKLPTLRKQVRRLLNEK